MNVKQKLRQSREDGVAQLPFPGWSYSSRWIRLEQGLCTVTVKEQVLTLPFKSENWYVTCVAPNGKEEPGW